METNFFKKVAIVCCISLFLSCDKDSDDDMVNIDPTEATEILTNGQWKISYYFDDKDETTDYANYIFTFEEDGGLLATDGDTSVSGIWSVADSDSSDDSTDGSVEFNIFFANPAIFEELTDDWDILNFNDNKIELKDVSGGDGTTDLLTFQKM